jgi:hypothetical protein
VKQASQESEVNFTLSFVNRPKPPGTAEVSSRRIFLLPRPTAAHSPEGRKILTLLELPPIPGSSTTASQDAKRSTDKPVATRFHRVDALIQPWQQDSILLVLQALTRGNKIPSCWCSKPYSAR